MSPPGTPGVRVAQRDALEEVVRDALGAGIVGLDTEFMRERTYVPDLCLVQLATPSQIALVDPLTSLDLSPLASILADETVEVVVHAGRQDFELLYGLLNVVPTNVFDVQLAAGFAGFGASLPYARLVELVVGIPLEKGEAYSEWCRRPLTDRQLGYAADDVRYLIEVARGLKDILREKGRLEWAQEEMRALESLDTYDVDPEDAWKRVAGRGTLNRRQLPVLIEVAAWRERTALERNLPRGWIIKDQTLVEIARRRPADVAALQSIRGMNAKNAERYGREIVAALKRGAARSAPDMERRPRPEALARARVLSGVADALVRGRCEGAGIAPELVATRAEVEAVLVAEAEGNLNLDGHRLLRGWRRDLAGDAVLALARGEVAVRTTPKPPYLEEVRL